MKIKKKSVVRDCVADDKESEALNYEGRKYFKIESVKVRGVTFTSKHPNNTARLNDGSIVFINKILLREKEQSTKYKLSDLFILVNRVTERANLFEFPTMSNDIGVDIIKNVSNLFRILSISDIKRKCVVLQIAQEKCAANLLHT